MQRFDEVFTESSVKTLGVAFDDMLTFSDHNISTHNIQKSLGGLRARSELCYRSPPSSTFVKQVSFPICNTDLLYLEAVYRGRHLNGSNIAEYHHPFSVRAQMVRSGVLPRGSPLVLNGRSTDVLHSPKGPCNRKASIPSEEASIPGRGRPCNTRFIDTLNRYRAVSLLL